MYVLLDLDGVMIPANAWKRPEILSDNFPAFSAKAVNALNDLLKATNAEIILTTSHKANYTLEQWVDIFAIRGIKLAGIARLPENIMNKSRMQEIMTWLHETGAEDGFVIIDDDKSLNDLPSPLKNKLVLTAGAIGLTSELADNAIHILKPEPVHFV
jgi:hypothetical protein